MKSKLRYAVAGLAGMVLVLAVVLAMYLLRLRSSAETVSRAAGRIHSTEDALRELEVLRKNPGIEHSEYESSGFNNHTFVVAPEILARVHLITPTVLNLTLSFRNGQLQQLVLVMYSGFERAEAPSVWIQESFDSGLENGPYVKGLDNLTKPRRVVIGFASSAPEETRRAALAINPDCFIRFWGCENAEEILPAQQDMRGRVFPEGRNQ